jgi:hypothetical protein
MWSDTLLAAEQSHLIRVALWAVSSAALGTVLVAVITLRRVAAPIAFWFGVQTLAWGSVELLVTAVRWYGLSMRDVSAATRLDRLTWLCVGLDVGIVGVGLTAAIMARTHERRSGAIGAGLGIVVQGLGLLVLDLTFAAVVARLV